MTLNVLIWVQPSHGLFPNFRVIVLFSCITFLLLFEGVSLLTMLGLFQLKLAQVTVRSGGYSWSSVKHCDFVFL